MRTALAILVLIVCANAQNPATPVFPTGKATDSNFGLANSNITGYTLNGGINNLVTSVTLSAAMVAPAYIRVDNEEIYCATASGVVLNGCIRGVNGTTPASHSNSNAVIPVIPSPGWNQILTEIEAMESNSYNLTANPAYLTCTAGIGGTTAHLLVKLGNDGTTLVSGTTCIAITVTTSDSGATGIAIDTSSAGALVRVAIHGQYSCTADGTITIGHLLGVGVNTSGRCGDLGQASTLQVASTTSILGKAISQTTISAGAQVSIQMHGPGHWGLANIPLYIADATNTNTYAGCPSSVSSYYNGMMVVLTASNANTSPNPSLNICGLGAKQINSANGNSVLTGIVAGGVPILLVYQSPNFTALSLPTMGESTCTSETSGSTTAYLCGSWYPSLTLVGTIQTGQIVWFTPAHTNTAAATLQASGGSTISIKRNDGTATQSGDLVAGSWYALVYDGTFLRIASNGTSGGGGGGSAPFAANQLTDATPTRVANTEIDDALPSGGTNVGIGTGYTNFSTTPVKFVGTTNPWCTAGGVVYFYVSTAGALMASANANVTLSHMTLTNVAAGSNTAVAFPTDGSRQLYFFTCGNTAVNQWDASPINDARAFLSTQPLSAGNGISITPGAVTSIAADPGQVTFFTHGSAPPAITGFYAEFFIDDTAKHVYQCFASTCTTVTSGQWQQIDAGGGGGGSGTVNNSSVSGALAYYPSTGTTVGPAGAHQVAVVMKCADSSGSATAQSCTTSPTFTPASGDAIIYTTTTANTGDLTVNVNSSSAVHVRKWQGSSVLAASDLKANTPVLMTYDGTYWEISTIGNAPSGGGGSSYDPMDMTTVTKIMQGCPYEFHDFGFNGGSLNNCQGAPSADDTVYVQYTTGATINTWISFLTFGATNGGNIQTGSYFGPILTSATFRPFTVEGRMGISSTSSVIHEIGAFGSTGSKNNFVGITLNTATSANWVCIITNSGGTTVNSTTITAADTSFHTFKVSVTAAGTASCSIDTTTVSVSGTFPTPSGVFLGTELQTLAASSVNLNIADIRAQVTSLAR